MNHQRGFESNLNRTSLTPKRAKISTKHAWTTETVTLHPANAKIDPRALLRNEHRSTLLESKDLAHTIDTHSRLAKGGEQDAGLPCYFQSVKSLMPAEEK